MGKFKKNSTKGITLIALVITIVVLLILAGVSISMLTGENGILKQAFKAKEETQKSSENEKYDLSKMEDIINESQTEYSVSQVTDINPGVLEGNGTDVDPYVINSMEDLVIFSYDVTQGNTYEGKTVKLGLSLDFNSTKSYVDAFRTDYSKYGYNGELKSALTTGEGFKPIGIIEYDNSVNENDINSSKGFGGVFDGNHNKIINLNINKKVKTSNKIILGLFSNNYGTITNLGIESGSISLQSDNTNRSIVAGFTGLNNGVIDSCYLSGNVKNQSKGTGSGGAGGIAAINYGTIKNSYNAASITGSGVSSMTVGGIVRSNSNGKIINCYNKGKIYSEGFSTTVSAGGISGIAGSDYDKCYNIGDVHGVNNKENAYARIGGIVGDMSGNSNNCYNIGSISGVGYYTQLGGIAGFLNGEQVLITSCYNKGEIIDKTDYENNSYIGCIVGYNYKGKVNKSYYLKNNNILGVGKTVNGISDTEEISLQDDMPSIISIIGKAFKEDSNNINNGYPILNWQ